MRASSDWIETWFQGLVLRDGRWQYTVDYRVLWDTWCYSALPFNMLIQPWKLDGGIPGVGAEHYLRVKVKVDSLLYKWAVCPYSRRNVSAMTRGKCWRISLCLQGLHPSANDHVAIVYARELTFVPWRFDDVTCNDLDLMTSSENLPDVCVLNVKLSILGCELLFIASVAWSLRLT